jgi:hypothetical protein
MSAGASSYGGGVMRGAPTPDLDPIAAEGMRFVNYYGQVPHFEEIAKYPNKKTLRNAGPFFMIPMENRPY